MQFSVFTLECPVPHIYLEAIPSPSRWGRKTMARHSGEYVECRYVCVYVCVYMYVCSRTDMRMYSYICMFVRVCRRRYVHCGVFVSSNTGMCVCVHAYVCLFMYGRVCMHVFKHVCLYACVGEGTSTMVIFCSLKYRYVCVYVCMYMYVCSCTDMCMYVNVHIYVCLYVLWADVRALW